MNKQLYNFYIIDRSYRNTFRSDIARDLAAEFSRENLSDEEKNVLKKIVKALKDETAKNRR